MSANVVGFAPPCKTVGFSPPKISTHGGEQRHRYRKGSGPYKSKGERRLLADGEPPVNSLEVPQTQASTTCPEPQNPRYCLGLDYVELTLSGFVPGIDPDRPGRPSINSFYEVPAGLLPGSVYLIFNQRSKRNSHYKFGFDIAFVPYWATPCDCLETFISEYGVGVMSAYPHGGNNCMDGSSIFQAYNHRIYQYDFFPVLRACFAAIEAKVSHMTRVDVCMDGKELLRPADAYYRDLMEVEYGRKERREFDKVGRATYDTYSWTVKDGKVTNFYVGGLKSAKSLNGYQKGVRAYVENKLYIVDGWRKASLIAREEDGKDVERNELRGRKEFWDGMFLPFEGDGLRQVEFWDLEHPKVLAGVMKAGLSGYYGFYEVNHNNRDKSKWGKVEVIDWSSLDCAPVTKVARAKRSSEVWKAKHASLKLVRDTYAEDYLQLTACQSVTDFTSDYTAPDELLQDYVFWASIDKDPESLLQAGKNLVKSVVNHYSQKLCNEVIEGLPVELAFAMAEHHHAADYLSARIRKGIGAQKLGLIRLRSTAQRREGSVLGSCTLMDLVDGFDRSTNNLGYTGTAAEGFPFPTSVPATCDARTTDVVNRTNFTGVRAGESSSALPPNLFLQSTEPGSNKKGVLDGMLDGANVSPNIAA